MYDVILPATKSSAGVVKKAIFYQFNGVWLFKDVQLVRRRQVQVELLHEETKSGQKTSHGGMDGDRLRMNLKEMNKYSDVLTMN